MSRSAAASSAGRTRTAQRGGPPPRRVSGPAAPPRGGDGRASRPPRAHIDPGALAYADGAVAERYGALPARHARSYAPPRHRSLAYGGVAVASRVANVALDMSASRFMDRVVRGRVWIAVIAVGLFGLVAMQVSLLKLNTGIGRAVQTVSTLERSNSALRSDITRLSAAERIQPLAEAQGLVMPAPADVAYLLAGAGHGDAARAVRHMGSPDPATAGLAGTAPVLGLEVATTTTTTMAGTTATVPTAQPNATATTAPARATTGSATGAAPTTGAATAPAATAPAATAPAATAPAATAPAASTGTGAAPAAPAATATADPASGGATPQAIAETP